MSGLSFLAQGGYYHYILEEGGCGIVAAESSEEAERKVREAYEKHSGDDGFSEAISIYEISQVPFPDATDVIEICDI